MSEEMLDKIPSMDTNELWNLFSMIYEQGGLISEEDYLKVRDGFIVFIDIRNYIRLEKSDWTDKDGNTKIENNLWHKKNLKISFINNESVIKTNRFGHEISYLKIHDDVTNKATMRDLMNCIDKRKAFMRNFLMEYFQKHRVTKSMSATDE